MPTVKCPICEEHREVKVIEKRSSGLCKSCAAAKRKIKVPKIRHFRICIECQRVDQVGSAKLTKNKMCLDCAKKTRLEDSYKRVCVDCGDVKVVKEKKKASHKRCNSCANRIKATITAAKRKLQSPAPKKKVIKKGSHLNKEAIAKQRELNKKHREEIEASKAKEIPMQVKTDQEMIAEYLKNNKITKIPNKYEL